MSKSKIEEMLEALTEASDNGELPDGIEVRKMSVPVPPNLARLLGALGGEENRKRKITDHDAQVDILKAALPDIQRQCDLKVGDVVYGRQQLAWFIRDFDQPHLVVEVLGDNAPKVTINGADLGMSAVAYKMDIVVAFVASDGGVVLFRQDSRLWTKDRPQAARKTIKDMNPGEVMGAQIVNVRH
jgi:hypothetical protein